MLLDTPVCEFGWRPPDFQLKDLNGQPHSVTSLMGENGLLLVFMCNHCPYVIAIIERLVQDALALQEQDIGVAAIMSNDYVAYPADNPENMKQFTERYNLPFPYLLDEDQSVAKAYGAVCTPDFFGFNNKQELQYRGRIDDARMGNASNRVPELLNAMVMIAETGKGPEHQTPSAGCSIKWR